MKKMLLILNPCSGQKKGTRYLAQIVGIFNRAEYTVIVHITSGKQDAEAAAQYYASQVDLIVCCGGDGTFQETVSGVIKSGRRLPIGYLPAGSTNDFASSLHLSTDLLKAAHSIVGGQPVSLDVGAFGARYFTYVASFGLFTRSSYATPQGMKNFIGHAAYVLSGIQELSQLHTYPLRFQLPDGAIIEDWFIFGAITNTTSVGGILTLDGARVDMADGNFELLLIRAPKDVFELRNCVIALQQKNYDCEMITFLSTNSLQISADSRMNWTLDGELEQGHSQMEVRCLNRAIDVIL